MDGDIRNSFNFDLIPLALGFLFVRGFLLNETSLFTKKVLKFFAS